MNILRSTSARGRRSSGQRHEDRRGLVPTGFAYAAMCIQMYGVYHEMLKYCSIEAGPALCASSAGVLSQLDRRGFDRRALTKRVGGGRRAPSSPCSTMACAAPSL